MGVVLALVASAAQAQYEKSAWPASLPSPVIQMTDLNEQTWNTADLKGKLVVLNFWATWCGPCKQELPSLQALSDASGGNPVVITVDVKESASKVTTFVFGNRIRLPVVLDKSGEIARQWGVRVFPTTVLIGADGQARWRIQGALNWNGPEARAWLNGLKLDQ
ncbi:TlpA disulfide reductase family protein [Limnohabitans sp. DM1]|uniref:TlpA family protein disulfide reductase n=1 Tax=Limnohabitans sp. DM1 TaxID=1597955 RepID=UPI001E38A97F|nr:TlpA disulfide reductase family protein [Limnohabitans sp. DM1]